MEITAIIAAAKIGDVERMRRLVVNAHNAGELVNFRCPPDGTTALYWTSCNGHLLACEWLIRHNADVNLTTEKSGSTPLHGAADRGHANCARLLIRSGSRINLCTKNNGDTSLHLAAYRGHLDVCRLLLEFGACAEIVNKQGHTPLQEAQMKCHYDVFRFIIKYRSDRMKEKERRRTTTCELDILRQMRKKNNDDSFDKMITDPVISCDQSINHGKRRPELDSLQCSHHEDERRNNEMKKTEVDLLRVSSFSRRLSKSDEFLPVSKFQSNVDQLMQVDNFPEHDEKGRHITGTCSVGGGNDVEREGGLGSCSNVPKTNDDLVRRLMGKISDLTAYAERLELMLTEKNDRVESLEKENYILSATLMSHRMSIQELEQLCQVKVGLEKRQLVSN